MTTIAKPLYGASASLVITIAALASDTNLIAGRQSTTIDNTSDLGDDALVGGKVMTGTSPTTAKSIELWAFGSYDGTSYSGGAGTSDANFSPTGEKTLMSLLTAIPTDATSNHSYVWGPFSVAQAFGGVMPRNWGVFLVHNTGVALNATVANHEVKYTSVQYQGV